MISIIETLLIGYRHLSLLAHLHISSPRPTTFTLKPCRRQRVNVASQCPISTVELERRNYFPQEFYRTTKIRSAVCAYHHCYICARVHFYAPLHILFRFCDVIATRIFSFARPLPCSKIDSIYVYVCINTIDTCTHY